MTAGSRNSNFLKLALAKGEFVCTAEVVLGRDCNAAEAEALVKDASEQADGIKVISLTDLPGGNPALPPEAFASYVLDHGLTPIAHLSGKDGNRAFLEARLHALARLGVENILALTGDAQRTGFAGKSKPVHDLDSVLILGLIHALHEQCVPAPDASRIPSLEFFAGAVANPFKVREPDLLMQLYKLRLKVAMGAQFVITQLGYNLRKLYELKQCMVREGIGHIPVLANIYVPTKKIAHMMRDGEIAGCVIPDELIRRLQGESKALRLERAALTVAAAQDLGFAGAHLGGFGLTHKDFMTIIERASAIGSGWRGRMDELVFPWPDEFYLFPPNGDGLSDGKAEYQMNRVQPRLSLAQRFSELAYRHFIKNSSPGARFFGAKLKAAKHPDGDSWRHSLWHKLLAPSILYRKVAFGCVSCGDCVQDHLNYAGCSMNRCYKELRNGPCGGSKVDGTCEVRADRPCVWNQVYSGSLAMGDDPEKFAHILVPPRDWALDRTNALANRFAGLDNLAKRRDLNLVKEEVKPC